MFVRNVISAVSQKLREEHVHVQRTLLPCCPHHLAPPNEKISSPFVTAISQEESCHKMSPLKRAVTTLRRTSGGKEIQTRFSRHFDRRWTIKRDPRRRIDTCRSARGCHREKRRNKERGSAKRIGAGYGAITQVHALWCAVWQVRLHCPTARRRRIVVVVVFS